MYRCVPLSLLFCIPTLFAMSAEKAPMPHVKFDVAPTPTPPAPTPPPGLVKSPVLSGKLSQPYMLDVDVSGVPKGYNIVWDVFYKDVKTGLLFAEGGGAQYKILKVEQAVVIAGPKGVYRVKCRLLPKGEVGEQFELTWEGAITQGEPPVPPGPTPPGPPTPGPVDPLTSFRVIFVYESEMNLTTDQRGVIYGKATSDWLDANCTGGKAGWRRRDKDAPGENDPTMAAFWKAVQDAKPSTPCIAMERNGKVEIQNLTTPAAKQIEVLAAYKGK